MARKIRADRIRIGMFVESVDQPWLDTPFTFQGFPIETPEDVYRIRHSCDYVYITDANDKPWWERPRQAQQQSEATTQFFDDLKRAKEVRDHSKLLIDTAHDDVLHNHIIDAEGARSLVNQMVPTIAHNPDAMVWITNLKARDEYTAIHSINVCMLSMAFGSRLGIREEALVTLGLGALLHDIGKLRVPLEVLNKPGKLTPEEFKLMQQHPEHGMAIIEATTMLGNKVIDVALRHHEKYTGGGYPQGHHLNQVSDLFPQIVSIVDTYDALTSDRCYRKGISPAETMKIMFESRGSHFHPNLTDEFSRFIGIEPIGSLVELNTGEVGITLFSVAERHAKPVVLLVLNSQKKKYYPLRLVDFNLLKDTKTGYHIKEVLAPGSYGVNVSDYVNDIMFSNETDFKAPAT